MGHLFDFYITGRKPPVSLTPRDSLYGERNMFSVPSLLLTGSGTGISSSYKFYIGCTEDKLSLQNALLLSLLTWSR